MQIKMNEAIQNKYVIRAVEVQKYYGIKADTIYKWYRKEKDLGHISPILISNPSAQKGKKGQVFVDHQSVIDYLNSGINKPQS